jgi:hypothetical protein
VRGVLVTSDLGRPNGTILISRTQRSSACLSPVGRCCPLGKLRVGYNGNTGRDGRAIGVVLSTSDAADKS